MITYTVQSPVLFIIFNRPDLTQKVFAAIKSVKPAHLYIAADGPRKDIETDISLCNEARKIATEIDWRCQVKTLFNQQNKGCKKAVSEAISWFFENENEGIILEDDCIPVKSFFYFCDEMLACYRLDTRIFSITGTNLQRGIKRGNASYFFSQYSNVWGWASWKRVWEKYDVELKKYKIEEAIPALKNIFSDKFLIEGWTEIFENLKAGKIDTWDYQLNFTTFFENGLCIVPNVNLISNIGFRQDATHTFDPQNHNAELPSAEMDESISHPVYFLPDKESDYFFLRKEFDLDKKWKRYNKKTKRFKRWIKSLFS